MTQPIGVILAGGQAQRMGGGDKGLLDLGGRRMLEEVIARLAPQCGAVILNANGPPERFFAFGVPVIADGLAGYLGPLAGVLAGMDHAAQAGASHIVTVAADTPFYPVDLVTGLQSAAQSTGNPIALAATRDGGRMIRHPTFGLWPVNLREDLRQALLAGLSKIVLWAEPHGVAFAEFSHLGADPFFNVNTAEDLAKAREIWQAQRLRAQSAHP